MIDLAVFRSKFAFLDRESTKLFVEKRGHKKRVDHPHARASMEKSERQNILAA